MDLKTLGAARREALMMVFQDLVSGGQAFPVSLKQAILSPSMQILPPVPSWLSSEGWTVFPDVSQVCSLSVYGLAPPWHLVSSFSVHLFLFFCFEFTSRMSLHENPKTFHLPFVCRTFQFYNPYGYYISKLLGNLADSNFSTQSQHPWKWTILSFFLFLTISSYQWFKKKSCKILQCLTISFSQLLPNPVLLFLDIAKRNAYMLTQKTDTKMFIAGLCQMPRMPKPRNNLNVNYIGIDE